MGDYENVVEMLEKKLATAEENGLNPMWVTCNALREIIALIKEQETIIEQYHKADTFLESHGWKWE